jgi:hypothetical protein
MADHSMLSQLVQFGLESAAAPGVAVPANHRVTNLDIALAPQGDFTEYRGAGFKIPTSVVPGDEWASGNSSGPMGYSELLVPAASILRYPPHSSSGPTDLTNGFFRWVMDINPSSPDKIATYTVQKGDGSSSFQWTHVYYNEVTLKANRKEGNFTGTVMGRTMDAGITPTPTTFTVYNPATTYTAGQAVVATASGNPTLMFVVLTSTGAAGTEPAWNTTEGGTSTSPGGTYRTVRRAVALENRIVVPQRFDLFFAETMADLGGASGSPGASRQQLMRGFDYELKLGNRYAAFFPMVSSLTSFAGIIEQAIDATLSLRIGMDTVSGDFTPPMTLFRERNGLPIYVRLQAESEDVPVSGGAITTVAVSYGGQGYAVNQTSIAGVTIFGRTGSGFTGTVSTNVNGVVTSITVTTGGTLYTGPYTVYLPTALGTPMNPATFTVTANAVVTERYHMHIDTCSVVNQPLKWEDQNGLIVNGWDMRIINDAAAGYPMQMVLVNKTASL